MLKRNNKVIKTTASIILSISLAMSSINIGTIDTKSVSAESTTNPIDTGNGYEYSTGRAIGMKMNSEESIKGTRTSFTTEEISNIIFDEYNISNCKYSSWGGRGSIEIDKEKYARRYDNKNDYWMFKNTLHIDENTELDFYFIVDKNMILCDYGKIVKYNNQLDKCQLLPYGGTKAYDVYGYDENGYDNKGCKTNGYDDAGYGRDGYDKYGYDKDGFAKDGWNKAGYYKDNAANPCDTGNGYEYAHGGVIGYNYNDYVHNDAMKNKDNYNPVYAILEKLYNLEPDTNDNDSVTGLVMHQSSTKVLKTITAKSYTTAQKRYPQNYKCKIVSITTHNTSSIILYFVIDENSIIRDFGRATWTEVYKTSKRRSQERVKTNTWLLKPYGVTAKNYRALSVIKGDRSYFTKYDAVYDFDGYDKYKYTATGYDDEGYFRDGYNKDGYNRLGFDSEGFDKNGYDKEGYDRDGYNKNGFDRKGYGRNGYNKNGFDRNNVCKDGYVYTECLEFGVSGIDYFYRLNTKPCYINELSKWNLNGRSAFSKGTFNFNVADLDKIKKSYSGCDTFIDPLPYSKKYTQNGSHMQSGVAYISIPKSYIKSKVSISVFHNYNVTYITKFTAKKTSYKFKVHNGDIIACVTSGKKPKNVPFAFKYVPSTNKIKKTTHSNYNAKMIAADNTNVTLKANKVVKNDVYLANIDARNVTVSTSNTGIVKVSKTNKLSNTYCQLKLTGGSKSGTATVTIKDKKSGKTQKITVTNK